MFRSLRAALLAGLCAALPAMSAHADPAFSPAQRAEIIGIVRDAMKSDPSILHDAIKALQADEDAKAAAAAQAAVSAHRPQIFNDPADATAGNPAADVTVAEFYDPRCPYCRRMLPGIAAILEHDHGIRIVYKDIPVLGPASQMESRAIVAAQKQGGYLKMQAALMTNPAQPSEDMIRDTARAIGLDPVRLAADMKDQATAKRIEGNMDLAHVLDITGTPTFVVGEQVIPGMVDAAQLEQAVANARKHAAR